MSMGSIRKNDLERQLGDLLPFRSPRADLEQYMTPKRVVAEVLWLAAYTYDDIREKNILDLGSGTGLFGIGAILLGARRVVAVDIDPSAVRIGCLNTKRMSLKKNIDWIVAEAGSVTGRYDTVVQNPPFGTRERGADLKFLQKALEVGNVVYSLHKSGIRNREVIKDFVDEHNGETTVILRNKFILPRTLNFHRRSRYMVSVDLYRIIGRGREVGQKE